MLVSGAGNELGPTARGRLALRLPARRTCLPRTYSPRPEGGPVPFFIPNQNEPRAVAGAGCFTPIPALIELQGAHAQFSYCFATQACAYAHTKAAPGKFEI